MQAKTIPSITPERFLEIRSKTEQICSSLEPEDVALQPADFVSPPKWHLAHTTWFFEQFVLSEFDKNYKVFNPDYAYYFNSYYNTVGDRVLRAERGLMTRPTLKSVLDYRAYVNAYMASFIQKGLASDLEGIIEIGLQHEQQHQELLI